MTERQIACVFNSQRHAERKNDSKTRRQIDRQTERQNYKS